jgi:hypothetical protein
MRQLNGSVRWGAALLPMAKLVMYPNVPPATG